MAKQKKKPDCSRCHNWQVCKYIDQIYKFWKELGEDSPKHLRPFPDATKHFGISLLSELLAGQCIYYADKESIGKEKS